MSYFIVKFIVEFTVNSWVYSYSWVKSYSWVYSLMIYFIVDFIIDEIFYNQVVVVDLS